MAFIKTPYRNIAISGLPGVGSTTLLSRLRQVLAPQGWTGYSGGEYMRRFVQEPLGKIHHHASAYPEDIDRQTDMKLRHELMNAEKLILESWLAGFLAQGIPHVLKVLVICSNDVDRAQRLALRDNTRPEEAFMEAFQRTKANQERWAKLYADEWQEWVVDTGALSAKTRIFFWNPRIYDLVIDTSAYDERESVLLVLEKIDHSLEKIEEV